MSWIDWVIVIVLAVSAIAGLIQGFFRTVCSLAGLILGLSLAASYYVRLAAYFVPFIHNETIANTVAFLLISVLVMVLFNLLGSLLSKIFKWAGLGCLDRLGGGVIGLLQGAVLVTLVILVAVAFFPQTSWLTDSRLPRKFFGVIEVSTHMTPDELAGKLRKGLRLLEQKSAPWTHPQKD